MAAKGAARVKDISKRLKVSHSSVTGALQVLADRSLVNYAPYDEVLPEGHSREDQKPGGVVNQDSLAMGLTIGAQYYEEGDGSS